ncbi:hypothetical protein M8818_005272 [Zalaria obscura]|uniref:Uncharacterized protein n=1 Tax=Zalaria obscura TaxID=2024903 RepID=A0ACC3SDQ0_9PEZI
MNPSPTRKFWSHTAYCGPRGQKVELDCCTNIDQSEEVAQEFLKERVLGFDLEWVPNNRRQKSTYNSIKSNISVIQLASESRIALFQIAMHRGSTVDQLLAPSLRQILESPSILKCGVNIVQADGKRLAAYMGLQPRGLLELSDLYRLVTPKEQSHAKPSRRGLVALATHVQDHLGLPLFKGKAVRCGNWDRELDWKQQQYAADDAYAGVMLYHKMELDRSRMEGAAPHPVVAWISQMGDGNVEVTFHGVEDTLKQDKAEVMSAPANHKDVVIVAPAPSMEKPKPARKGFRMPPGLELSETIMRSAATPHSLVKDENSPVFSSRSSSPAFEDEPIYPGLQTVSYPTLPTTSFSSDKSHTSNGLSTALQELDPNICTPNATRSSREPLQGTTKRLFSALRALRIRVRLAGSPLAADQILEDLAWCYPRNDYDLSLVPGGKDLASAVAKHSVDLLAFIQKHAPND